MTPLRILIGCETSGIGRHRPIYEFPGCVVTERARLRSRSFPGMMEAAAMREAGLASTDAECGALIGRKPNQVLNYKRAGADRAIALACAAVLAGLPPYGDNP